MRTSISIIVLALTVSCLGQESTIWKESKPEKQEYIFPEGYSPDGRIGSIALTVFGGYTTQNNDMDGYHVNGRLDFIMDGAITLFLNAQYQTLRNNDLPVLDDLTATSFSIGFRLFGGMK